MRAGNSENRRKPLLRSRAFALLAALAGLVSCGRGTLRVPRELGISVPYEIETLDPHARDQVGANAIASHFYEPLVTTDATMQVQPCLARRWENPDPSTWIFHLREGVVFDSGRPMQAADVVYTFERLLNNPTLEISTYAQYIAEVQALDPLTVRIRMTRPLSLFLNKLHFIVVIPRQADDRSLQERPDGTGPYRLVEWKKGEYLRMTRNERYWGRKPDFASVILRLDRSPEAAVSDLLAGRSRLIQCNSKSLDPGIESSPRFRVIRRPSVFTVYLSYDLARPVTPYADARPNPFRSRQVREAISKAIDRKRLVARLTRDALAATQLVPPFIFGFNPRISPPAYDPEGARALLRQAGLQNGFAVTLDSRKLFAEAAEDVKDQLATVGIRVNVVLRGTQEFYTRMQRRDLSFYLSAWGCSTGDASDVLNSTIHTRDPERQLGLLNYSGFSRQDIDQSIEESATIQTVDQRRNLLQNIMERVMDELVWVPLCINQDVYVTDGGLTWEPRSDSHVMASEIARRGN
jgi:peptide/nickel transport system substrate-binding protein